jgi:hypothetical protein
MMNANPYLGAVSSPPTPPAVNGGQQQRPCCSSCKCGCSERLRIVLCCFSLVFDVLTSLYLYFGEVPSFGNNNNNDNDNDNDNDNNTSSSNVTSSNSNEYADDTTTSPRSMVSVFFLGTAALSLFFLYVELRLAWDAFRSTVVTQDRTYLALSAKYVSVLMLLITEGFDSLFAAVYWINCGYQPILAAKLGKNCVHLLVESWEILLDPTYRKALFGMIGYIVVYVFILWYFLGGAVSLYFDICTILQYSNGV